VHGFLALLHHRGALKSLRLGNWLRSSHLRGGSLAKQSFEDDKFKKIATIKRPKAGKLQKVPFFPPLKESSPRAGLVEEAGHDRLAKNTREL
jgi:hypothetical protein